MIGVQRFTRESIDTACHTPDMWLRNKLQSQILLAAHELRLASS